MRKNVKKVVLAVLLALVLIVPATMITIFAANTTTYLFAENFEEALRLARDFLDKQGGTPLVVINSWNEWTETSYLEPDDKYGYGYLEAIKRVFCEEE